MKTCLVTGAARRLGADLARCFARDGFNVALHAHSSVAQAQALSEQLCGEGRQTSVFSGDLSLPGGAKSLLENVAAEMGAPDIIVNNASLFAYDFPGAADEALLRSSLEIHLLAPVAILEAASRLKQAAQRIAVFNILDQKLLNLNPDFFSYTVGKAGLHAAGRIWRSADRVGVRVFGILPGLLSPSGAQSQQRYEEDVRKSPLQRGVSSRDIYDAIAFFARHENLPGQDFAVDAGESLTGRKRDVAFE